MVVRAAKPRLKPRAATLWGARPRPMATSHGAASHSDRAMASWTPGRGSADADLIPEMGTINARARDMVRNNPLASGVGRTKLDNIIGSVLRLNAKPDAVLRHIAAGLNLPYELLTKDFSETNYSSARAALLEAWRYFLSRRRWLVKMGTDLFFYSNPI